MHYSRLLDYHLLHQFEFSNKQLSGQFPSKLFIAPAFEAKIRSLGRHAMILSSHKSLNDKTGYARALLPSQTSTSFAVSMSPKKTARDESGEPQAISISSDACCFYIHAFE